VDNNNLMDKINRTELSEETILLAQAGDQTALEKIFASYKSLIRSIANSYFLMGGDKDDLLQEGMFGLYKAIRDYKPNTTSFVTFAHLCILRQILNAVKRYSANKNKPLDLYLPLDDEVVVGLVSSTDPLEQTISRENQNILTKKIETLLSPLERKVVSLFIKGYSYEEISQMLSKSHKAVDGALQRARKKLA